MSDPEPTMRAAADESPDARQNRQSRQVAEWEADLALARQRDEPKSSGDGDREQAGAIVSRAHRAEKNSGQSHAEARSVSTPRTSDGRALSYGAARESLAGELLKDAAAHEAGHYDEIGRRFDGIERQLPSGTEPVLSKLRIALTFWDGWIDARNREWKGGNIEKDEWSVLARGVASDLSKDSEITDARVVARFDASAAGPTEARVRSIAARLRVV